jgi:hypothetical protein
MLSYDASGKTHFVSEMSIAAEHLPLPRRDGK